MVTEIIDSGPMCITDLFQNNIWPILTQNEILSKIKKKNLIFTQSNLLVRKLQDFFLNF